MGLIQWVQEERLSVFFADAYAQSFPESALPEFAQIGQKHRLGMKHLPVWAFHRDGHPTGFGSCVDNFDAVRRENLVRAGVHRLDGEILRSLQFDNARIRGEGWG